MADYGLVGRIICRNSKAGQRLVSKEQCVLACYRMAASDIAFFNKTFYDCDHATNQAFIPRTARPVSPWG